MKRITVTGCSDCPFKRVDASITCRLSGLTLMGAEPGSVDVISDGGVHPDCELLKGRVAVTLACRTRSAATGMATAFVGNRVRISDGTRGVVVAKYPDAKSAGVGNVPEDVRDVPWYRVLLDGSGYANASAKAITEIMKEVGGFNHNPDFEFHFGYGDEDDD
jgi:hypothetical protein